MEITRTNVNEIVEKCGLKPDKDYGQNYLIDPVISKQIVDALEIKDNDKVLEVGPGIGSLTHFILLNNAEYTAVDIDSRMTDFLKIPYKDKIYELINDDIRKVDVQKYSKIISNLPYNITTEAVLYLVLNGINCNRFVLMCQSEAFGRFNDTNGKEYGPVSILIHLLGNIKRILTVKPGSFYPSPKCSSTVFYIDITNNNLRENIVKTYSIAKQLFINRRKTIYNNLQQYLGDKDKALKILESLNTSPLKRPEELSPSFYYSLMELLNK